MWTSSVPSCTTDLLLGGQVWELMGGWWMVVGFYFSSSFWEEVGLGLQFEMRMWGSGLAV